MKDHLTTLLAELDAELLRQIASAKSLMASVEKKENPRIRSEFGPDLKPVFDSITATLAEMRTLTRLLTEMEWKESHDAHQQ